MPSFLSALEDVVKNCPEINKMLEDMEPLKDPVVLHAAFGRMNKLSTMHAIQRTLAGGFPKDHFATRRSKTRTAVLIPPGEGFLYENCKIVSLPSPNDAVRCAEEILCNPVGGGHMYELLMKNQRTLTATATHLPKLGLTVVSCADPRRNGNLDCLELSMMQLDNFLPSLYHMADNQFDLRLVRDFWGPVLVFHNTRDDFDTNDLRLLHLKYFGPVGALIPQLAKEPLPNYVVQEYKAQHEGKRPTTDLAHQNVIYPSMGNWTCAQCGVLLERPADVRIIDEEPRPKGKRCGRCLSTRYCSKECQTAHWPQHRAVCLKCKV